MGSVTRTSLPPISHPSTHSSVVYQGSLSCASHFQAEHRKCSGIATLMPETGEYYLPMTTETGEYYLPMTSESTHYYRGDAPFLISPPAFGPLHHCSGEPVAKAPSLSPASSSFMETNPKSHDDHEPPYASPHTDSLGCTYTNVNHPSRYCASATSSDNDVQHLQDSALTPIDNRAMSDSRHSSDEGKYEDVSVFSNSKEDYSEEMSQSDTAKLDSPGRGLSPASKMALYKKIANAKISEKRRQQNRAAQRAMRERRKRAAQHQEIHMSAIMTENAILRENVNYLSNVLLSRAMAPTGHLQWNPMQQQENLPLNAASLSARCPAAPASSSHSALPFRNHTMHPAANLAGPAAFPSAQSTLNYYSSGPLELEYFHQGHHPPGLRNLSCPSSNSNLSRPSTAGEASVDNRAPVIGHWLSSSSHEGVPCHAESPIAVRMAQFVLNGPMSTDSPSINTASTISSPEHTDAHLLDTIPTSL